MRFTLLALLVLVPGCQPEGEDRDPGSEPDPVELPGPDCDPVLVLPRAGISCDSPAMYAEGTVVEVFASGLIVFDDELGTTVLVTGPCLVEELS